MPVLTYACHVAYWDDVHGEGLLVLPSPRDDVTDPFPDAWMILRESEWDHAVIPDLRAQGWEPTENEEGDAIRLVGYTPDGREVIGLYGENRIVDRPTIPQQAHALAALAEAAGVEFV